MVLRLKEELVNWQLLHQMDIFYLLQKIVFSCQDIFLLLKYFEIEVEEKNQEVADKEVTQMCEKLLANLIIEDYKINKL